METVWYLFVLSISVAVVSTAVVLNFVNKVCDQSNTFVQTFGGIDDCIDECERRPRCKAIMFRPGMNHCSLKENVDISSLGDGETLCMYLKKTDWLTRDLGPCNKSNCGETEKCVTSKNNTDTSSCLKSECRQPNNIANAYLLSKSNKKSIGSINRYICKSGYTGFDSPAITCKEDATWSTTTFRCTRNCKKPKTVYNGLLSRVENGKFLLTEGTVVHFTCGVNFQGNGPVAKSICKNGNWSPNRLQCCDNGTELWPWGHRCTFYTGLVTSYGEANDICLEKSYRRTGINDGLAKRMIERYGGNDLNLLTTETKTYLANRFNFTKCLEINDVTNSSQYEHFTYDEMVKYIRNQTLTGWECDRVKGWAPEQPDGGNNENCIARSSASNYHMFDITCTNLQNENVGAVCYKDLPVI